jgi:hypothetical protein
MTTVAPDLSLSAIGANPDESKRRLPVVAEEVLGRVSSRQLHTQPRFNKACAVPWSS